MRSFQAYILYVNDTTKGKRMDGVIMAQESAREFALLTDQEISQLRIKTGKGHRTQNDKAVRSILRNMAVLASGMILQ